MTLWEKITYEYNKGHSAIRQIIMVNVSMFILTVLVGVVAKIGGFQASDFLQYFYTPSNLGTLLMQPWSIVTGIFFHAGFWHIVGNMVLLYFLGNILEDFMSYRHVWSLFLWGGLAGVLLFVLGYNLMPEFHEAAKYKKLLGASGGVTAIVVAIGIYLPRYVIRPFGLFNVELRWVALLLVFRDLYLFPVTDNTGGFFAHIGGAILGAVYILQLQGKIRLPHLGINKMKMPKMKKVAVNETKFARKTTTTTKPKPNQEEIDAILDKISQSGYDSLSNDEKNILFKASE